MWAAVATHNAALTVPAQRHPALAAHEHIFILSGSTAVPTISAAVYWFISSHRIIVYLLHGLFTPDSVCYVAVRRSDYAMRAGVS